MKHLALIPLLFVASCASRPQLPIRPLSQPTVEPVESVRYSETVRMYNVGRFVDPNHPDLLHEGHPVYRVESSARWNFRPGTGTQINSLNPPVDAAFVAPLTNDVLVAEMNRQRAATAHVMSQAVRLSRSYEELQRIIAQMQTVARNNATLNTRLFNTELRVAEFGRALERISVTPPTSSSDAPPLAPESEAAIKP